MSINYNTNIKLGPINGSKQAAAASHKFSYKPDPLIYDKNEEALIYEAIKIGYLIYPSRDIIWKAYQEQANYEEFQQQQQQQQVQTNTKKKTQNASSSKSQSKSGDDYFQELMDFYAIRHLNLSNVHALEIGDVCYCERLQVLNLSSNYLIRIESLIQCTNLIRLDLHNNQISQLPDMKFWGRLKQLKILYLHNNPIGKLESLRRMAACPALEVLTLYDTPLSLKKNYRHHVVNIIFTLKALDDYIVSDEEIIEDAKFDFDKFASKAPSLHCNLYIPPSKTNDYHDEMKLTNALLKRVNSIIAKFSPVHIIQKFIRGTLDRRFVKEKKQTRLWATVKIQKWWRKLKKLEYKPPRVHRRSNLGRYQNPLVINKEMTQSSSFQTNQSEDYRGKRYLTNTTPASQRNNLVIDLNKLQNRSSSMLEALHSEAANQASMHDSTILNFYSVPHDRSRSDFDVYAQSRLLNKNTPSLYPQVVPSQDSSRKKKLRRLDMDKFFELGQLLNKLTADYDVQLDHSHLIHAGEQQQQHDSNKAMNTTDAEDEDEEADDDEKTYRLPLKAFKSDLRNQNNYIVDLINEKKFYRHVIQEMEMDAHKKMYEMRENIEIPNKKPIKTNDQRFFQKIYGTMTLGCLRAVDKAYLDRNIAERKQSKSQAVQRYKDNKDFTHQQVNYYREERLREVQKNRERDKLQLTVARRRLELDKMQGREQVQETKVQHKDVNLDRRKDILVAVDFNKQHLSVSKALQKHEYNLNRETQQKKNTGFVEKQRTTTVEQQEIVRKYLEQRSILRISQTQADREKIDSKILTDANDRLLSSKRRVAKLKATKTALSKFYALHNGTKTSDRTVSSFAIPASILQNIGKTPQTDPMRVTVLDTTALDHRSTTDRVQMSQQTNKNLE